MAWYDDLITSMGDPSNAGLLSAGVGALGTAYAANQSANTQNSIAAGAQATAQQAAADAAFRPVGVTSRFGSSGFQYDPQGRLTGAGYQVAPDIAAQREALLGMSNNALTQAQQSQMYTAPSQQAAQSLFGLGGQFLPSSTNYSASPEANQVSSFLRQQAAQAAPQGFFASPTAASQGYSNQLSGIAGAALPSSFNGQATPEAQAYYNQLSNTASQVMPSNYDTTAATQRYMQQQQALLAPQREQQLAGIRNQLQQTGRSGLSTGATSAGGMGATNPEMAAYYNSIAQQDAQLGANAQQQARSNLQSDIGLASQLGNTGLSALNNSQQFASQNALNRGAFGAGLMGQGYGATTAAGQQNLNNSLNLGNFAAGQMGTALQTQTSAEEIARQRMLSNISTGTGLYSSGLGLMNAGYGTQQAALSPYNSYLSGATGLESLGQNALTSGAGLGSSIAAAGANSGKNLLWGQQAADTAYQNAARTNAAATQGSIAGLSDPISSLIRGMFTPPLQQL